MIWNDIKKEAVMNRFFFINSPYAEYLEEDRNMIHPELKD